MLPLIVAGVIQFMLLPFVNAIERREQQCFWIVGPNEWPRDATSALGRDLIDMNIAQPGFNADTEPIGKKIRVPCIVKLKEPAEWVNDSLNNVFYLRLNGYKAPTETVSSKVYWLPTPHSSTSLVSTPTTPSLSLKT